MNMKLYVMDRLIHLLHVVSLIIFLIFGFVKANSHVDRREDGEAQSTNYPRGYPANEDLTWTFTRESGVWLVRFIEVDIRSGEHGVCGDDYLVVSDMRNIKHSLKICGKDTPSDFVSKGSAISVRFQSGSRAGVARRGFLLAAMHGRDKDEVIHKSIQSPGVTVKDVFEVPSDGRKGWMTSQILIVSLSCCLVACFVVAILLSFFVFRNICSRDSCSKPRPLPQTVLTIQDCSEAECPRPQRTFKKPTVKPTVKVDPGKIKLKAKNGAVHSIGNDYVALKLKESGEMNKDDRSARGILHSDSDTIAKPLFVEII